MDRQEAIRLLETEWKHSVGNYSYQNPEKIDRESAIYIALEALRAQEEAEKNEPLSLGELVRIENEPLWILEIGTGRGYWALADICGGDGISLTQIDATYEYSNFKQYGKEWLAFRHKPKEENK